MDKHKPFLTKRNPLNIDHNESERFNLKYLLPTYWLTWIGILFSLYHCNKVYINYYIKDGL